MICTRVAFKVKRKERLEHRQENKASGKVDNWKYFSQMTLKRKKVRLHLLKGLPRNLIITTAWLYN